MNNSIYDNPNFVPNTLPTIPDEIRVYSVQEVADILHTSKNAVYGLIHAGVLPCIKIGRIKIRHDALAAFLEKAEGYNYNNPYQIVKAC